MEVGTLKFAWRIKNFSKIQDKIIYSDVFSLGPYKWKIQAYPKGGSANEYLSIYLTVEDSLNLPFGWIVKAKFAFTIVDQIDNNKSSFTKSDDTPDEFSAENRAWGYSKVMSHKDLYDPKKGYLVEDTCIIKVDVTMYEDDYLESHVASNEDDYLDSLFASRGFNASRDFTKEDDLTKNATEEDIDAFFGDLNSVIFPKKNVSLEEEAKEALAMIEDALNLTPAENDNPGRVSQLRNAFDVLSSLDDYSVLTLDQKEKLLSMKDDFMDLPERAANAGKKRKLFSEREVVKKTLDHRMGRYLIEFKKVKAETKNSERNIAFLQELADSLLTQISKTKKKRESLLSKQKEMFKVSMEVKAEFDVLVKKWPEYEAEMKSAEEEEKIVSMKWDKMKKLVLSLKTPK